MKKILFLFLALSIFLTCTACHQEPEETQSTVTVFYRASDIQYGTEEGVIAPCQLNAAGHESDTVYLLDVYFSKILSEEYITTFPRSTRVVSLNLDGLTAKIVLSNEFSSLTGLNLSIACACLTQTIISLTGCQEVIISAESAKLDGNNFITLTRDSYLLLDESGAD